ncbi:MAG TPA: hypothetical protein VNE39_26420 [Planctomycetota bacterium]|nr:hypothetical protein [Planctomycetota bacterium]
MLDLDEPRSWDGAFAALVYEDSTWSYVKAQADAGEDAYYRFLCELEEHRDGTLAARLWDNATPILCQKHTHVVAYHGCRVGDRRSYEQNGIVPSNPEKLIASARGLFRGIEGIEDALRDVSNPFFGYLNHNENKVFLLVSGVWAKKERCEHVQGSELVQALANRLADPREAWRRFIATGTPTLIKCAVPVDWLDRHTTYQVARSYAYHVVRELIRTRLEPNREYQGCQGGYALTRGVPPENLLEFVDMTEFANDEVKSRVRP